MLKHQSIKKDILVLVFLLCSAAIAVAADTVETRLHEDPISIKSDKMTLKGLENKIIFEGNVFIEKGDLKIEADHAEVFLIEKNPGESPKSKLKSPSSLLMDPISKGEKEVFRIEAFGNVGVQQGDKHARAQKGVYNKAKNEIVLTGEPEAWENDYRVKGKVITLFIAENRSLVEGSQVVIHPGSGNLKLRSK